MAMRLMSSVGFVCVLSMEDGEGLVDFHTEEPVKQHAALRDDDLPKVMMMIAITDDAVGFLQLG